MTSKSAGEEVTKASIRKSIWDHIEAEDLANFPRPVHRRIPNFKGAAEAGDRACGLDVFKDSQTVKINPDKPQEQCRFKTLEDKKALLVSTPRRKTGLFSQITPPEEADEEKLKVCSTALGVRQYSSNIGLEDKVKVDLVIVGSVAVSEKGWRIGKGEGFADLEYAMMASMGAVDENTIIVTTVHDCQVTDIPDHLIENHDIVVDYIVTPTKVIECEHRKKPSGIIWSKITRDKLQQVPILKKLRKMEEEAGKDVTLSTYRAPREERSDGDAEGRDGERRERRGDRDRDNKRRSYFRQRRTRGPRNKDSESGEGQQDGEGRSPNRDDDKGRRRPPRRPRRRSNRTSEGHEGSQGEGEDKENMDQRRRPYNNRRFNNNRRRRQVSNRSEDGGEDGGDSEGRDDQGQRRRQRRQRPRRPRDSEGDGDRRERSSGEEEDGGERRRRRRRPDNNTASIFVGGLPKSVRVSDFKKEVRDRGVQPLRVVWRGGNGHAFLVFENKDEVGGVVQALQGLSINDKNLKIELSNRSAGNYEGEGDNEAQD